MKIMKYILLTFALFYLNVSIWGQEKSIGITLEDVAGMKEKEKEQEKAMRTPRNTFIVNLGYGWITSRVEMRSGFGLECAAFSTDFPEETVTLGYVAPSLVYCQKIDEKWIIRGTVSFGYAWNGAGRDRFSGIAAELSWGVEYMLNRVNVME